MRSALSAIFPAALVLAPALIGLTGCIDFADFGPSDRFKQDFHYSYPLSPGGTVSLENANGSVEIFGWDQNKVDIDGTKYASSQSMLDAVKIETSASSGSVRIRTERPVVEGHGGSGARYTMHVPKQVLLDSIVTTNGGIRVENIDGDAITRSTNGTLRILKVHGKVQARTTNGSIEAENVEGNSDLRTTNGNVRFEGARGSLEVNTSNGSITADLTDPAPSSPMRLHSSNGRIDLRLGGPKLPDLRADTSNSSITLHLPAGANARLRAHTSHASVTSDFDSSSQGGSRSRTEIDGDIGTGGPVLDLSSSNGSIKILKM